MAAKKEAPVEEPATSAEPDADTADEAGDVATETEAGDEQAEEPEEPKAKGGKQVTRTTAVAWWCPVCDYSHPHDERVCSNCGYKR